MLVGVGGAGVWPWDHVAVRPMSSPTDLSEAEQHEDRLQALIDSSPLALVEFGLDTRIRLWNPAAERIFGWPREEILGREGLPMAPAHRRAESEDLFARVRAASSATSSPTPTSPNARSRRSGCRR